MPMWIRRVAARLGIVAPSAKVGVIITLSATAKMRLCDCATQDVEGVMNVTPKRQRALCAAHRAYSRGHSA